MSFMELPGDVLMYLLEYISTGSDLLNYMLLSKGIHRLVTATNEYFCNVQFYSNAFDDISVYCGDIIDHDMPSLKLPKYIQVLCFKIESPHMAFSREMWVDNEEYEGEYDNDDIECYDITKEKRISSFLRYLRKLDLQYVRKLILYNCPRQYEDDTDTTYNLGRLFRIGEWEHINVYCIHRSKINDDKRHKLLNFTENDIEEFLEKHRQFIKDNLNYISPKSHMSIEDITSYMPTICAQRSKINTYIYLHEYIRINYFQYHKVNYDIDIPDYIYVHPLPLNIINTMMCINMNLRFCPVDHLGHWDDTETITRLYALKLLYHPKVYIDVHTFNYDKFMELYQDYEKRVFKIIYDDVGFVVESIWKYYIGEVVELISGWDITLKCWPVHQDEMKILYMIEYLTNIYTPPSYTVCMTKVDDFCPMSVADTYPVLDFVFGLDSSVEYTAVEPSDKYKYTTNIKKEMFKDRFNTATNNIFHNKYMELYYGNNGIQDDNDKNIGAYVVGSIIMKLLSSEPDRYTMSDVDIAIRSDTVDIAFEDMVHLFITQFMEVIVSDEIVIDHVAPNKCHIVYKEVNIDLFRIFEPIEDTVKTFHLPPTRVMYDFSNIYGYASFFYSMYTATIPAVYISRRIQSHQVKEILNKYRDYGFRYLVSKEDKLKYFD